MEIIDVPQEIMRAVKLTWTMDNNHGFLQSGFTGAGQVQRGQLERWSVDIEFKNISAKNAGIMESFFMELEGNVNVFRMIDPARQTPCGCACGCATLKDDHDSGCRVLRLTGLTGEFPFSPGDWLQVGNQLVKVVRCNYTDDDGCTEVKVRPKLHRKFTAGTEIKYQPARGLFRFTSELPSWEYGGSSSRRPVSFKLTGQQEVITDNHPLAQ